MRGELGVSLESEVLEALIDAVQTGNPWVRAAAAEALGAIGSPHGLDALIEALGDEDEEVRQKAVEALGVRGDARAVGPLCEALRDGAVAQEAAVALGRLRSPAGVDALVAVLLGEEELWEEDLLWEDGAWNIHWDVQWQAAHALGEIGDPKAVETLRRILKTDDQDLSETILNALGKIRAPEADHALREALRDGEALIRRRAVRAVGRRDDALGREAVVEALADTDVEVRLAAAEALGDRDASEADIALLIVSLRDEVPTVRKQAARALGNLGHPKAVGPVSSLLTDPDAEVRRTAAEALGAIGSPDGAEALVVHSTGADEALGCAAAEALGRIGTPEAAGPLLGVLGEASAATAVRAQAALALGQMRARAALGALIGALRDPEPQLREAAAQALGNFPEAEATEALITTLGEAPAPEDRRYAARALSHATGDDVVEALIAALGDESPPVRREAAGALAHRADPRAVDRLCEVLSDWEVTGVAAYALGEIGEAEAVPALLERFREGQKADKLLVAQALGNIGDERARGVLLEAVLREPDPQVRRAAAQALRGLSGTGDVETLLAVLRDTTQQDDHPAAIEALSILSPTAAAVSGPSRRRT